MRKKPYVIVRCPAGLFFGTLESRSGTEATVRNARRMWYWKGAASISQIANEGVKCPNECKFPAAVKRIDLTGVIEILHVTERARKILEGVPEWRQ